jgi:hypothetical protein
MRIRLCRMGEVTRSGGGCLCVSPAGPRVSVDCTTASESKDGPEPSSSEMVLTAVWQLCSEVHKSAPIFTYCL